MKWFNKVLQKIPGLLSSKVSIAIYLFLFGYLVLYALICTLVPSLSAHGPSATMQLIMGNYTNVLSALGASIAAGAGVAAHQSIKAMHTKHDALQKTMDALHEKLDRLEGHVPPADGHTNQPMTMEDARTTPSR